MNRLVSAGLLMFNRTNNKVKFFLVHPGGPFFVKKGDGYWGIPKGLIESGEDNLSAAKREFEEETGIKPEGKFIPLSSVKQKSGKTIHAWAFETKRDKIENLECNTFDLEWPPKSGNIQSFPEIDQGEFYTKEDALKKINTAQADFIFRLEEILKMKGIKK